MRIFRGDIYQSILIATGVLAALLFGIFLYRELFPEYKIYQNAYRELEIFRASYSNQPIPPFSPGIKQIVMEKENKGPAEIDRCISCHVALQFEHFSPTKIARDINGGIRIDENGIPIKIENENYVFSKLDQKIKDLETQELFKQANQLASLKTAKVGNYVYDMTKVLKMHPLIGKEVRAFEFHPIDEYGCIKCHNGNGRGLTTPTAHGPIFDEAYETEFMGHKMQFLERDEANDPLFSKVFNHKPSHELLFMTTPLYVGGLIEAKCIQCHKTTEDSLAYSSNMARFAVKNIISKADVIKTSIENDIQVLYSLNQLETLLESKSLKEVLQELETKKDSPTLSNSDRETLSVNIETLKHYKNDKDALAFIKSEIKTLAGNQETIKLILSNQGKPIDDLINLLQNGINQAGTIALKAKALNLQQDLAKHALETQESFQVSLMDQSVISSMKTDIDYLTNTYQKGKSLYISQGCYACHRIAGISRAGVGPELTKEGQKYPWFVKESIVWPQADLKTSTMPNMRMDHEEVEALTTFLLAQTGKRLSDSETGYKIELQEWESGKRNAWENPIPPSKLNDLKYGMTVFATEGCAACHRLKGFESNVGFAAEKNDAGFYKIWEEKQWFQSLFPEEIRGSVLATRIEANAQEIDEKIANDVRQDSLLEEIEKSHPGLIESFYSEFKFASRSKKNKQWTERVRRVLMLYIQEYGLGRLIGPRPNWSGIFRSDEWLMEHFRNPSLLVPRSIMPVLPFDDTKYYALTKMLDVLSIQNRDHLKEIWNHLGFSPEIAYHLLCAQCHGDFLQGNGPVSEWIYPVPKNLRNANFLRNLTKEKTEESITHGVKGTPMPPWGEVAEGKATFGEPVLTQEEVRQLVDWLYSTIPGSTVIKSREEVLKWNYTPENVIEDLRKEDFERLKTTGASRVDLNNEILYAARSAVDEIFDITPYRATEGDPKGYYIKKKLYTQENIDRGHTLFDLNCATCHGKDADGRGARAQNMVDAKPRMLTNLTWLETRDDLRLLKSIKYGVPGTSMTPWGDVTSGLQRLQLVMYIRTLSEEARLKEKLSASCYKTFDSRILALESARSTLWPFIEKAESKKNEAVRIQTVLKTPNTKTEEIAKSIRDEIKAQERLVHLKSIDQKILDLITATKLEKQEFLSIGAQIITLLGDSQEYQTFIELIYLYPAPLKYQDGMLDQQANLPNLELLKPLFINSLQKRKILIQTEIDSLKNKKTNSEISEKISELVTKESQYEKLINKISFVMDQREKRFQREQKVINLYNQEIALENSE